ncbi:MAG: 50S ribosomal protein L10 [bacterium]|jgi:large subunit ribosomal protein L10|nr:50S ribosomal protein L10 [bacterium]
MPTPKKEAVIQDLGTRLGRAKAVYVADYSRMNVAAMTALRAELRKADAEIQVVKNNLIRMSLQNTVWADAGKDLHGPSSLTLAYGEAPVVAKVLRRFALHHNERPVVKAIGFEEGVHGGEFLATLATMPTRDEALGMLAGVLNSIIASFARVLNAVADARGEAAAPALADAPTATDPTPDETAPDAPAEDAGEKAEDGAAA